MLSACGGAATPAGSGVVEDLQATASSAPVQPPATLPGATQPPAEVQPPTPAAEPTQGVVPTQAPVESPPPSPTPAPAWSGPQLAFLKAGDLWLLDWPGGSPRQLTQLGNLKSFTWSSNGLRLAAFDGRNLCVFEADGSQLQACLDLQLDERQSAIERQLIWSPDQRTIVVWNPVNPYDEGAIGWLIVPLDGSGQDLRIEDPVDWGASLAPNNEPGGITGQPVFLADGSLVGALTHRVLCGSGGCHYQLFQFDINQRSFSAYPNNPQDGWSEGPWLELSKDRQTLGNLGVFFAGCESYVSFVDFFELASQARQTFNLDQESVSSIALAPDKLRAVIARSEGCAEESQIEWAQACGLSQGLDVYAMQYWDLVANQRYDLLPGVTPNWSADGGWIAFRSCLTESDGEWTPNGSAPPAIYIIDQTGGGTVLISEGSSPQWKP
jgi:hypothetical protein